MAEFLRYLTLPYLLSGIAVTIQLTLMGFFGGLFLGLLLGAMNLSRFRPVSAVARAYIVIYRGTPLILQLVFVFTALPHIGIALPPLLAGGVALALNEAAFFAEIVRSGVRGVDAGQVTAARALGMRPAVVMRRIVGPQAVRTIVPGLGSEAVATMKNSALASIIAVPELTLRSQQLASATFDYFGIYFASGVMYLAITGLIAVIQLFVENALDLDRTNASLLERVFVRPVKRVRRDTGPTGEPAAPPEDAAEAEPFLVAADTVEVPRAEIGEVIVEVRDVHKRYGEREVLKGIELSVKAGEVVALLGPSGSGKSTLLRTLNRLETVEQGAVIVAGSPIGRDEQGRELPEKEVATQRAERRIGMVFQHFNLFAHLTAKQNIMAPLVWVQGLDRDQAARRADELLDQMGLASHADSLPRRLSGGQQQRIGIARALAADPRILLLDEPTSALDPELVADILGVIRGLVHRSGLTMVIATHQLGFARDVADRVVFMSGGRVVEEGPARDVIERPESPLTARFVSAMQVAEL